MPQSWKAAWIISGLNTIEREHMKLSPLATPVPQPLSTTYSGSGGADSYTTQAGHDPPQSTPVSSPSRASLSQMPGGNAEPVPPAPPLEAAVLAEVPLTVALVVVLAPPTLPRVELVVDALVAELTVALALVCTAVVVGPAALVCVTLALVPPIPPWVAVGTAGSAEFEHPSATTAS